MSAPRTPAARASATCAGTLVLSLAFAALAPRAHADSIDLVSARDNTLYETGAGTLSNGAGTGMFAGRTNQLGNPRRRALVRFDVAGAIPSGSTIASVTLRLQCTQTATPDAQPTGLHRVLADWGEGASNAGAPGGAGALAKPGDATWIYRFYATSTWANAGGDFSPSASAVTAVDSPGPWTWGSTADMVSDVQAWLDAPAGNFGWLVLGNEAGAASATRFETREAGDAGVPTLHVEFQPPSTPVTAASWGRVKDRFR